MEETKINIKGQEVIVRPNMNWSEEYNQGWRYIVWVGGFDDYYTTYEDAKLEYDIWKNEGYDEIGIEKLTIKE